MSTLDTRGGEEVLHGISFRVEPGQTVALVGSSGAGKSTIAQLLSRLYDVDRAVRFGGAVPGSGLDVRDVTFDSMRHTLGMVTQDGHLFHESIASNLRLAKPDATDDDMGRLRQARLEDHDPVPAGRPGHRGGGARLPALRAGTPALTIARLLISQPRVVILDEATAALDSTNEAAVQEASAPRSRGAPPS